MDTLTPAQRSERMSRVRRAGNRSTELRLVELLRAAGICGWRRGLQLSGAPDFVFPRERVAVFVDGCFWHGCPRHRRTPKSRIAFWTAKLTGNMKRDRAVTRDLRASGWMVVRIWECALARSRAKRTLTRITRAIGRAGSERVNRPRIHCRKSKAVKLRSCRMPQHHRDADEPPAITRREDRHDRQRSNDLTVRPISKLELLREV